MSPLRATCRSCGTQMIGEYVEDVGDLMIAHHRQGRLEGSWTSGACGIFFVEEVDDKGNVIEGGESHSLETTMNVICLPYTGKIVYDPRRKEGR